MRVGRVQQRVSREVGRQYLLRQHRRHFEYRNSPPWWQMHGFHTVNIGIGIGLFFIYCSDKILDRMLAENRAELEAILAEEARLKAEGKYVEPPVANPNARGYV